MGGTLSKLNGIGARIVSKTFPTSGGDVNVIGLGIRRYGVINGSGDGLSLVGFLFDVDVSLWLSGPRVSERELHLRTVDYFR